MPRRGNRSQSSPWPTRFREAGCHLGPDEKNEPEVAPGGSHTATVGTDGRYTLQSPPRTYTVTGTSPPGGNNACPADRKVNVGPNQKLTADVYCVMP